MEKKPAIKRKTQGFGNKPIASLTVRGADTFSPATQRQICDWLDSCKELVKKPNELCKTFHARYWGWE